MATTPPARKASTNAEPPGCLILFFLIFLAAGLAVGWMVVGKIHEGFRIHNVYVQGTCTIISKKLHESDGEDGTTYRPVFEFEYEGPGGPELGGDGKKYQATGYDGADVSTGGRSSNQAILNQYKIGGKYTCWYDPSNPQKAVLVKPSAWNLLWGLFPLPFIAVGLFGTVWVVRSKFRRRGPPVSAEAEAFKSAPVAGGIGLQTVPEFEAKPGDRLAFKLVPEATEKAAAIGLGCFGMLWTGITGFICLGMIKNQEWLGVVFLGLFVLVGLGILGGAIWQALIGWGVGETRVEVANASPAPGEKLQLLVRQFGHMAINELSVWLVCEEQATYQQGTNTRTDKERVLEERLAQRVSFVVAGQAGEELAAEAQIPADAMHAFKSKHNAVRWLIEVRGDVQRWPDFKRVFPVRVQPAPAASGGPGA